MLKSLSAISFSRFLYGIKVLRKSYTSNIPVASVQKSFQISYSTSEAARKLKPWRVSVTNSVKLPIDNHLCQFTDVLFRSFRKK
jgi:hypothetical protein